MVAAPIPILDWKAVFRKRAKATRKDAAKRQPDAGKFAARAFIDCFAPIEVGHIALYHPTGDELDTWPLAEGLAALGHHILLPVVTGKNKPLVFRVFDQERPLVTGPYGIDHPDDQCPEAKPDIIVTPLLSVRPDGARLGMGGGYYDRTLKELRATDDVQAIGYGYAAQQADRFPVDTHDQFLDGFVSEQGAIRFNRQR